MLQRPQLQYFRATSDLTGATILLAIVARSAHTLPVDCSSASSFRIRFRVRLLTFSDLSLDAARNVALS